ncbi:MAG TPA: FAD binding domain-containing protein [Longimicrobiales bacterium]|nr:FAD binding domain-containing protein [Longimicrobiales bacterium]
MLRLHEYTYHRPKTVAEAAHLLASHPGRARLIAGGTDLMPNMKHGLFTPQHLIALKQIRELHGIEEQGRELVIGAAESLSGVSRHPLVRQHFGSLARAAGSVAGPQLRNMGTIGGNLCLDTRCTYYNQTHFWRNALGYCLKKDGDVCHVTKVGKKCVAAHSADTAPVLMTLGAVADLESANGTRSVPVSEFFIADGIENTVREWNEVVTRVRIPLPSRNTRTAFRKVRQRGAIDFPLLNIAVAAELSGDLEVEDMRIVVSALGSRPRVVSGLDKVAKGRPLDESTRDAIAQRAFQQCHPLTNIIVDPEWRRAMVPVYVKRALADLAGGQN